MAKKSIYETSFAAGHTGGLYEAELQGVGDVWSDIEASQSMTALKGERRGAKLDTILSGLELTSQVAGGLQARGEFQSSLKTVAGDIDPSGDTSFEKVKVGGLKKLFQEPSYKIGDKVMSKSDISIAGEMIKYGGTPKYDRFKFKPDNAAQELVDNDQLSSKSVKSDDVGGKFYGERKGFDIGDIVGEKSIFAAGKQKLSSVLSSSKKSPPPPRPGAPKLGIQDDEPDIEGDQKVGEMPTFGDQRWDKWESPKQSLSTPPPVDEYQSYGDYAKNIGKKIYDLFDWTK